MTEGLKAGFGADARPLDRKAGGYPVDFVGAGMGDDAHCDGTLVMEIVIQLQTD